MVSADRNFEFFVQFPHNLSGFPVVISDSVTDTGSSAFPVQYEAHSDMEHYLVFLI